MKTTLSTFLASTLLLASVAEAGPGCYQPSSLPPIAPVEFRYGDTHYGDLLARCQTTVTELEIAQRKAGMLARNGQFTKASDLLLSTLGNANYQYGRWAEPANPHTVEAIKAAYEVAQTVHAVASRKLPVLGQRLTAQIKYMNISKLYQNIFYAYRNLDVTYYPTIWSSCQSDRCRDGAYGILPDSYYNGVADLARKFLYLQVDTARAQADDDVELAISGAVARAAKHVLVQSVYRRDFACVVSDLHRLEQEIASEMSCNPSGIPKTWFVQQVRSEIKNAASSIRVCGSYY